MIETKAEDVLREIVADRVVADRVDRAAAERERCEMLRRDYIAALPSVRFWHGGLLNEDDRRQVTRIYWGKNLDAAEGEMIYRKMVGIRWPTLPRIEWKF